MNTQQIKPCSKLEQIVIWGCGQLGHRMFTLQEKMHVEILAYTDSRQELWGGVIGNTPVVAPQELKKLMYDYILIAVADFNSIRRIQEHLKEFGIASSQVRVWNYEEKFFEGDSRINWIRDFAGFVQDNGMRGSVAECGVFRGDSAKFINAYFPDRKLYLFDTFEGFEEKDIQYELSLENEAYNKSVFTSKQVFENTNVDLVMSKMVRPENVKICKGYFPESARDVDDTFCFVNLDMDLYVPMFAALHFFWDKMINKGVILLHDYFYENLPGVRKAVTDFEKEQKNDILKMTIGDGCSIALLKQIVTH